MAAATGRQMSQASPVIRNLTRISEAASARTSKTLNESRDSSATAAIISSSLMRDTRQVSYEQPLNRADTLPAALGNPSGYRRSDCRRRRRTVVRSTRADR